MCKTPRICFHTAGPAPEVGYVTRWLWGARGWPACRPGGAQFPAWPGLRASPAAQFCGDCGARHTAPHSDGRLAAGHRRDGGGGGQQPRPARRHPPSPQTRYQAAQGLQWKNAFRTNHTGFAKKRSITSKISGTHAKKGSQISCFNGQKVRMFKIFRSFS